jgi:bacterioferritin
LYEKSVELLVKAVAVHQYMYFYFHCEDAGYDLLVSLFIKTAIEDLEQIERCVEWIIFLVEDVEMVLSALVELIRDVKQRLDVGQKMAWGLRELAV